jgi:hypothetical protein
VDGLVKNQPVKRLVVSVSTLNNLHSTIADRIISRLRSIRGDDVGLVLSPQWQRTTIHHKPLTMHEFSP